MTEYCTNPNCYSGGLHWHWYGPDPDHPDHYVTTTHWVIRPAQPEYVTRVQRTEEPASTTEWVESHEALYTAAHTSLLYFKHMDQANSKIHCAEPRYSPITFRLAEALSATGWKSDAIEEVMAHRGQYKEDRGR